MGGGPPECYRNDACSAQTAFKGAAEDSMVHFKCISPPAGKWHHIFKHSIGTVDFLVDGALR
eukprot:scaffold2905_cov35-Tisochrysis_lutea.AAC.2